MSLGSRLVELRKEAKLSQEEVAEKINVSRQTISKWETDGSTPDFDKIAPLCELYGISANELITGKKDIQDNSNINKEEIKKKNRTIGLVISILLYFISVIWIMIAIPVMKMNPIIASAIFLLICAIATCIIIYTSIIYKADKTKKENNPLVKQIDNVLSVATLIIYLLISFTTMAWHITWMIWLIYGLVMEIIKLVLSIRGNNNEE